MRKKKQYENFSLNLGNEPIYFELTQKNVHELIPRQMTIKLPMVLPERFPKMLPLNGGFRYPASVICVTVSRMQIAIKTTIDVTGRAANIIFVFFLFVFPFLGYCLYVEMELCVKQLILRLRSIFDGSRNTVHFSIKLHKNHYNFSTVNAKILFTQVFSRT